MSVPLGSLKEEINTDYGDPGVYGAGLSANIRAAYGFLCHNFEEGDEIFFFGFSRGAYTARSIAGLTTTLGLLTKRGMDKFQKVYEQYYDHGAGQTEPKFDQGLLKQLTDAGDLRKIKDEVKIIGVWDTVGFHFGTLTGEKIEFYNEGLSEKVQHAYHALALNEGRSAFFPTLWQIPRNRAQDLQQVWFSGTHSEVGGGLWDSRLPDISLGWMIARCAENDKLSFIDGNGSQDPPEYYLLDHNILQTSTRTQKWGTAGGWSESPTGFFERGLGFLRSLIPFPIPFVNSGYRTPKSLITKDTETNEKIHLSIRDHDLKRWPCVPLSGTHKGTHWLLANSSLGSLEETTTDVVEDRFKGRMWPVAY